MIRNDQEGYQIKQTSLHWAITGRQVFRLFEGLTKTCSASRGYKLNLTTVNDALKILCQCGILLCKKLRISVPKWNFSVIYDFLRDWSRPGLPCFLSLLMLSSQARGTSAKSSLFPSRHKGIFDESMAVWGPSLRSFPAIFTDHGHINKVILFSECLQGMVGTSLWMTLAIANFLDSWKLLRFSENFKIFGKFWDFWKILRFSKIF